MEEAITAIWKIASTAFRLLFEFGFDIGLRYPGMAIQKICWPPYWFGKVEVGPLTYLAGIGFYVLLGIGIYHLDI